MSFSAMAWAAKQKTGSPTKKLILLLLADRANDTGMCWPSINTIAEDCELNASSVKRNIKTLESDGFLSVRRTKSEGVNLVNKYLLNVGGCRTHQPVSDEDNSARDGALVGAESTKGGRREPQGVGAERDTNLSVEPINEPIEGFDEFWLTYDKKQGKESAQRFWRKLSKQNRVAIQKAVPAYVASTPDKKFRMAPATFINPSNKRWEDEIFTSTPDHNQSHRVEAASV